MPENITGMMVYYYIVCKRKLWYFNKQIQMEDHNENVSIGKELDDEAYSRNEKHISVNNTINVDFIDKDKKLHEIKKSRKIEKASIMQMKYYLYYLKKYGMENISGEIDFPLLKQKLEVNLSCDDEKELEDILMEIENLCALEYPPKLDKKGYCKKCAYYDICFV